MDRAQKQELVSNLNQVFQSSGVVVVSHYSGLTVREMTDLRRRMRAAGASFRVTKNRLTKLALSGTACEPLTDLFTGPTAIGFSEDPISAPKVLAGFAKENEKLIILGGVMGETVLDTQGVKDLASLPSLDEVRAQIIGLLNAPATKVAGVLQAPAGQLARVMGAYAASEAA